MSAKILGSCDMTTMRACFQCVSVCFFCCCCFFFFYGPLTVDSFFNGKMVRRKTCNIESCEEGAGKDRIYNWLTSFSSKGVFLWSCFRQHLTLFPRKKIKMNKGSITSKPEERKEEERSG